MKLCFLIATREREKTTQKFQKHVPLLTFKAQMKVTLKFGHINRWIRARYHIIGTREIKQAAVITLWLSHSSCAFSDTDITTKGQADHHWWLYSQTLRHCRPKISTDTLGSHLDTSRLFPPSFMLHSKSTSLQQLLWSRSSALIFIQMFVQLTMCTSWFLVLLAAGLMGWRCRSLGLFILESRLKYLNNYCHEVLCRHSWSPEVEWL